MKYRVQRFLFALCLALATVGCSVDAVKDAAGVLGNYGKVKYLYENGKAVEFLNNASLSQLEIDAVHGALDQVEESKARLHSIDSAEDLITGIADVDAEYEKIKSSYLVIREIAINHKDEYSYIEWAVLSEFDKSAKRLDEEFNRLVDAVDRAAAISKAVSIAGNVMKVAAIL